MHLSMIYSAPCILSSTDKSFKGGSKRIDTFSSLCRRTGGMSVNDCGVDATSVSYSSGEICAGTLDVIVTEGIGSVPWSGRDGR